MRPLLMLLLLALAACGGNGSPIQPIPRDTVSPVITLVGDDPQIIEAGNAYSELGATASDNTDGDLTNSIVIDASEVNTEIAGDYTVTYDVRDAAGNAATTVTRTIRVVWPPAPEAPAVSVAGGLKTLVFSWTASDRADYYRLLENADGHSGFSQVGEDIPADTLTASLDIAAHLFDWANAQYVVEACNLGGCGSSSVSTATNVMLDTIGYFKASNTDSGDRLAGSSDFDNYGWTGSVALSGDGRTLVAGAPQEEGGASGINGNQEDDSADHAGAVYVYRKSASGWVQQAYIKGSGTPFEMFGSQVAVSNDGNTLAIGTPESGFYVYRFGDDQWGAQQISIANARCESGGDIAISGDGSTLVVGIPGDDNYRLGVGGTTEPIPPPLYEEALDSGAVCLYRFNGDAWYDEVYIKPSDTWEGMWFGDAVDLDDAGTTLAVGAPDSRSGAYVFRFDGENWLEEAKLAGSNISTNDRFAGTLALAADGNRLAVGAPRHTAFGNGDVETEGAVFVFDFSGGQWIEQEMLKPDNLDTGDWFGRSVALDAAGELLAVGARNDASAAAGVDGDRFDNSATGAGAVYMFSLESGSWIAGSYVKAGNPDAGDRFGDIVSLSADGTTLAVGAPGEDSDATGIGGKFDDNSADGSGAVYIY